MRKYLKEVEARLLTIGRNRKPDKWLAENYIGAGQSRLTYLNIKIPEVRNAFRQGFSFSNLPADEQWQIWNYIWRKSNIFEVMLLPSYWAAQQNVPELFRHRQLVLKWLNRVDNWAHSDEMSAHYAKLLEHNAKRIMPEFKRWSKSKNPWFKRQSMVGLIFYSRFRKKLPQAKILLQHIERHIDDDHYYVQKGVGWTVRECWNAYPSVTLTYLKKNAHRIPSAGWTAATEKLSAKDKAALMILRRQRRSAGPVRLL